MEYECPCGHRFICSAPDRPVKLASNGTVKVKTFYSLDMWNTLTMKPRKFILLEIGWCNKARQRRHAALHVLSLSSKQRPCAVHGSNDARVHRDTIIEQELWLNHPYRTATTRSAQPTAVSHIPSELGRSNQIDRQYHVGPSLAVHLHGRQRGLLSTERHRYAQQLPGFERNVFIYRKIISAKTKES